VLNTDAEGRLILADALSYASEQNPRAIIDFATLTGAIGIALGQEAAGLFSNDADLARQVWQAGESSGDRVWEFPMWDEYREHVKGTVSDVKNIGIERRAGSIAAAVFLEHFVGKDIPVGARRHRRRGVPYAKTGRSCSAARPVSACASRWKLLRIWSLLRDR
jgi:leucyl aminopeptidase